MKMFDKYYQFREDIAENGAKKVAVNRLLGVASFLVLIMAVLTVIYPATMLIIWCVLAGVIVIVTVINVIIDSVATLMD